MDKEAWLTPVCFLTSSWVALCLSIAWIRSVLNFSIFMRKLYSIQNLFQPQISCQEYDKMNSALYRKDMSFEKDFELLVRQAVEDGRFKNASHLADAAKVSQGALSQYLNGKRPSLRMETIGRLLDTIGFKLLPVRATYPATNSENEQILRAENEKLKQTLLELQTKYINLLEKNNKEGEDTSPPSSKSPSVAPQKQTI